MGRFASTVAYYESARPPYGAAFFEAVALELGMDGDQRLLDVGAGPGILAIGFAPYCREVLGVDPEPGMVEAARAAAKRAGVAVRFIESRFEDVAGKRGKFDIVSIGRAIHWLDPEPARAALDRALAPHGRVLVCGATSAKDGRNRMARIFQQACAIAGRAIGRHATIIRFSPTARSPEQERSGSRGPTPFRSSVWSNVCCQCRRRRQSGSATKFPL